MASKAPALLVGVSVLVSAILLGALFYRFHGIPNTLEDGFDASPVAVGSELYLRGHKFLYRISE